MVNGQVRYFVIFRHYDHSHEQYIGLNPNALPLVHRVEVSVQAQEDFALEIRRAQEAAWKVIADACDNGYLKGDLMDYEAISTRRRAA